MSNKDKSEEHPTAQDEQIPLVFAKIYDPKNEHLFTTEAARKAFAHVKLPSNEEEEIAQVRKQLDASIRVMQQREKRRSKMVRGLALGGLIAFVLAVLASLSCVNGTAFILFKNMFCSHNHSPGYSQTGCTPLPASVA